MSNNKTINAYDLYLYCCERRNIAPLTESEWQRNGCPTFEQYTGRKFYEAR